MMWIRSLVVAVFLLLLAVAPGEAKVVREYTGTLNINTASAADLSRLPGIGNVIGQRIQSAREERGPFKSTTALRHIKGISPRVYEGLRKYVATSGDNTLKVRLDLNTITKPLLLGVPGMTGREANSILNYRRSAGGFRELEELQRVPGITAKRYEELAESLTVVP